MPSNYNPFVHRFARFTVAWTVLLFVAGALVTSNDAALSVPDWPKSFGTWFPTLRQLAGTVGSAFRSRLVVADFARGQDGRWWFIEAGPGSCAGTGHEAVFKAVARRLRGEAAPWR